ncbi:hypothetical protein [Ferruginibacter sp.]
MKQLFFASLLLLSTAAMAQNAPKVPELPATKEEFVKSEKDFISIAKWLESTAIGIEAGNRKLLNAWTMAWLTNSPTVTITVRASILKLFDKNPELMMVYMGGYARYCLENSYSKDELKCNIAGIKAAINCYNLGGEIKKDKALAKVIEKDGEGKLEEWVTDAMKAK